MKANNKIILIVAALFVAVVLIAWYGMRPSYDEISKLTKSIAAKKVEYDEKKMYVGEVEALKKSYLEIDKSDREKLGRVLPQEENITALLPELEVVLIQNGLNIGNLGFENFSDNKSSAKKIPKFIKGDTKPVKVSIDANGSYESFRNFLTSIEWNERLMDIADIGVVIQSNKGGQGDLSEGEQEKFSFKVELYAYWLK